jgi:hypothetical protein
VDIKGAALPLVIINDFTHIPSVLPAVRRRSFQQVMSTEMLQAHSPYEPFISPIPLTSKQLSKSTRLHISRFTNPSNKRARNSKHRIQNHIEARNSKRSSSANPDRVNRNSSEHYVASKPLLPYSNTTASQSRAIRIRALLRVQSSSLPTFPAAHIRSESIPTLPQFPPTTTDIT